MAGGEGVLIEVLFGSHDLQEARWRLEMDGQANCDKKKGREK